MSVSRTYSSPLREEQMEQTRERILDQVAALLAEQGDVTVAEAAQRARVSVRTAYRYFPTREALIDGMNQWVQKRFGTPHLPERVDDLPVLIESLIRSWGSHEALVRASRRSGLALEAKKRRKGSQVQAIAAIVAAEAPDLDDGAQRRAAAVIHQLISADTWLTMRDHWGFTDDECIKAVHEGLDTLVAKLRKDQQHAKKTKR